VNSNINKFTLEHKLQREQFDATLNEKEQSFVQTVINSFFFPLIVFDDLIIRVLNLIIFEMIIRYYYLKKKHLRK
jgi:hypothetical protein